MARRITGNDRVRITGNDRGVRVRVREGEAHMQGGRTGVIVGWSVLPERVLVKLTGEPDTYFAALPDEIEVLESWKPVPIALARHVSAKEWVA